MPELNKKVETYIINYVCDECGEGLMLPTGMAFYTSPLQYEHRCDNCGDTQKFHDKKYPLTQYRYIDE